jgi:Ser-tRNA(Ala) deacylase AlaX
MPDTPAYYRDPRLTRLETEVVSMGEEGGHPWVVLADTILYPEGGGQPADRGAVEGVPVRDVRTVGGAVRHVLAGPAPAGRVWVELDWERRFDHMQQHTAQHLLTAVADLRFGWPTTAFHLGGRLSDIELDTPSLMPEQLLELEEAAAVEIRAARPVSARHVSPAEYARLAVRCRGLPEGHSGDIRLVEIAGLDLNTCGGTHLDSTAEIEALKLLDTESLRGGTRLCWVAGRRLRRLHQEHHERNARLRGLLGTSDDDLAERVAARLDQARDAERALRKLEEELAAALAAALATGPGGPVVSAHWPGRSLPFLQTVAREAAGLAPHRVFLLTAGVGEEGTFVLCAGEGTSLEVPAVGQQVAHALAGRGGGSGRLFQGRAGRLSSRAEAARLLEGLLALIRPRSTS